MINEYLKDWNKTIKATVETLVEDKNSIEEDPKADYIYQITDLVGGAGISLDGKYRFEKNIGDSEVRIIKL